MKSNTLLSAAAMVAFATPVFSAEALASRELINGKDLTGWTGKGYVVEDGAIYCTPQGSNLVTEGIFSNYVLDFEFVLTAGANNGLGIHYPGTGDAAYVGMELQVLDSTAEKYKNLKDYQFHGSLYTLAPAKQGALKPVGEWNHERVTINGPLVKVEVNDKVVLEANLDELNVAHPKHMGSKRRSGHIAFCGHGDRVGFRNMRISELPPTPVATAGETPLFDGKSLAGWKPERAGDESWSVMNGVLKHKGTAKGAGQLWTEKEYGDFTMAFDWRWASVGPMMKRPVIGADGNETAEKLDVQELDSGVYVRGNEKSQVNLWNWPVGSGEVYGYRTNKSMSAEVRAGVTPKMKADKALGEWNHTVITMKGDRLTVVLNGQTVIDQAQLPNVPAKGKLALQHHGSSIDFANLTIKE